MLGALSSTSLAHVGLVSSSPANGSRISESPRVVRLEFNKPVEVEMSRVILLSGEVRAPLALRKDLSSPTVIVADLSALNAGSYDLLWKVLSTDGHSLSGMIHFSVVPPREGSPDSPRSGAKSPAATSVESGEPDRKLLGLAMFLRGAGVTALMAFAGLLLFAAGSESDLPSRFAQLAAALAVMASTALLIHFLVWLLLSGSETADRESMAAILRTNAGRREAIRTTLTLLGFFVWWITKRIRHALPVAFAGIVAGAFVGHAAAISSAVSIPLKAIHLIAGAVWLGGLAWLLLLTSDQENVFAREARKVSRLAGACVVLVVISGLIQSGILLSWDPRSITSSYGIVSGLKLAGVGILALLGAYNRFKLVPIIETAAAAQSLQWVVRREVLVMTCVAMLGGVLAYLSPEGP